MDQPPAWDNVSSCAHIVLRWWRRSYGVVFGLRAGATGDQDHEHGDYDRFDDRDDD
jgi:hypothetical protein